MNRVTLRKESESYHGVVLDTSESGFDQGVASFGSFFVDEDDPQTLLLYYVGAQDDRLINSGIGLAISKDGLNFRKEGNDPVLAGSPGTFCHIQTVTPVVTRIQNKFYMILSGKSTIDSSRKLGIAYADDPEGPWHVIGELIKPESLWEGNDIDNGPSIVRIDNETILVYYSSVLSTKRFDVFTMLRRYSVRRIGILKVRIRGTSLSSIEAMRFSGNPLKHFNGPKGSWNESLFCPGYIKLNDAHYLFPAASTYSTGFPYKQYIGMVKSNSPYFTKETSASTITKLIDGPAEKSKIMPHIKNEIALDSPAPYFNAEKHRLFLYYSVADRTDEKWKTALTTYDIKD